MKCSVEAASTRGRTDQLFLPPPTIPVYCQLSCPVLSHFLARTCEFMLLGPALFLHPAFHSWLLLKLPQSTTHREQSGARWLNPRALWAHFPLCSLSAESPWLWLHPPSSRLDLKPGAVEPQFEAPNISFLGLCIFGSDKAQR